MAGGSRWSCVSRSFRPLGGSISRYHSQQGYVRRLFHDYGYPKSVMVLGAPVSIGSEGRQADIVIYESELAARQKDQGRAKLIVETKAPNERHGVGQLKSYIFASAAEGGVWINETDAPKYFRRVSGRLEEWPNVPRFDETWEDIGRQTKSRLRPPHDLVETFKRCHNALYKVGIDSEDLAMDMVRIILAKYQDEENVGDAPEFRCGQLELQSAEGRKRVAARVRSLFSQIRDEHLDVFDEHETITAGDREIAVVVAELQAFRFLPSEDSDIAYDVVGAAYEVYIGSHLKGDRGQYFTHRLIVTLLTRLVDPTQKDSKHPNVCDGDRHEVSPSGTLVVLSKRQHRRGSPWSVRFRCLSALRPSTPISVRSSAP